MVPGANVSNIARRHRICTSLVYRWRRVLLRDGVSVEAPQLPGPTFVPVAVAGAATPVSPKPLGPGLVEVVGPSGQRVRLAPPVDGRGLKGCWRRWRDWFFGERPVVLGGRGQGYALSRWSALTRYAGYGRVEIDNDAAERSLRGIAVLSLSKGSTASTPKPG